MYLLPYGFSAVGEVFAKSIRALLPYGFNKIIGFSKFDGWMNLNRIHMKILKSQIDFKSFLQIAQGYVLYGKTTRGSCGDAQKIEI